jgi:tetrahydromethanopterin:alpha-L-glutamate ligase
MIHIIKKPTDTPDDNSTGMVVSALEKRNSSYKVLNIENIDPFDPGIEGELIWVCGIRQDGVQFETLSALGLSNTVVNSPESIATCASKVQTTARLIKAGVPTPETIFTNSKDQVESFLAKHEKVVYKPVYGFDGNGIYPLTQIDELGEKPYYIQEFIRNNCDYRVFVIDGEAVGAIRRSSDSFAHNIHQGGFGEAVHDIPENMAEISSEAAKAIGIDYCGVDLLPWDDSYLVLEVNGTPNWHCMGVPIPDYIAEYLIEKEKSFKA